MYGMCFFFTTYLSCLGRGLNIRDSVGAGEFLGLPCVHSACREVTFVSHKHHGNIVWVLHSFNLFSVNCKTRKLWQLTFNLRNSACFLNPPLLNHSEISLIWDPPCFINNSSSTTGEPTTQGALGPWGRARARRCWAVLHCWRRQRKAGRGRDGQQAGGEQHYLITTAASSKRQAARGNWVRGVGQINLWAQPFFSLSHSTAGCIHLSALPICSQHC